MLQLVGVEQRDGKQLGLEVFDDGQVVVAAQEEELLDEVRDLAGHVVHDEHVQLVLVQLGEYLRLGVLDGLVLHDRVLRLLDDRRGLAVLAQLVGLQREQVVLERRQVGLVAQLVADVCEQVLHDLFEPQTLLVVVGVEVNFVSLQRTHECLFIPLLKLDAAHQDFGLDQSHDRLEMHFVLAEH